MNLDELRQAMASNATIENEQFLKGGTVMSDLYYIENIGCDDKTRGLVNIPDEIIPWFKNFIENLNKNSQYGCMPTIEVYKINETFIRPVTDEDSAASILHLNTGEYVMAKEILHYNHVEGFKLVEGVERIC